MNRRQALFALWTTCLIWGLAFPLAKLALRDATPMAFGASRFLLASLLLLPLVRGTSRDEWLHGAILGLLLSFGFALQNVGLSLTTASRSAFITALYLVFVPLIVWMVYRALPERSALFALVIALTGMAFLTQPGSVEQGPNLGDLLTLLSSVSFAAHLVATGAFARRFRVERLMLSQIFTSAVFTSLATPFIERPSLTFTPVLIGVILYEAVVASVIAIPLQLAAQRTLSATHTALVYTVEPVIATLASMALLGDRLSPIQWLGGALIAVGSLLPELSVRRSDPSVTKS